MRTFVELFAGAASVSLRLFGGRPPLPYMGSKWRYAQAIIDAAGIEKPDRVVLCEPGPWGWVWLAVAEGQQRRVADLISVFASRDPLQLYHQLLVAPATLTMGDASMVAARYLLLQRLTFRGKPVTLDSECRWRSHGFNRTSGYGLPATQRFGEVKPQLPRLAQRVAQMPALPELGVYVGSAIDLPTPADASDHTVYIDPPYQGTTDYGPHTCSRDEVLEIAERWHRAGAHVIVSEREPIRDDWHSAEITRQRAQKKSSWQTAEWLTSNRPLRVPVGRT